MKKNLFSWMAIAMMAFACVGLAACGGDDGDNGGNGGTSGGTGSGALGGNGYSFNYNRGYFYAQSNGSGKTDYFIMIYNCDYFTAIQKHDASMIPNKLQSMTITFSAEGSTSAVPTGEFKPFEAIALSIDKQDLINRTDEHGNQYGGGSNTNPLKITKSGDKYTISFDEIDFINYLVNDKTVVFSSAFTYTGTLAPVPEGYFSVK